MNIKCLAIVTCITSFALSPFAHAWGKRGHQIVGETAAQLVAAEPKSAWMKSRSFDFGYYNNVPDFIWKRPATYEKERHQHFMDIEIFERAFQSRPDVKAPLELTRAEFEAKFPEVKDDAGRAFWRIREMVEQLEETTADLKALAEPKGKARQDLQSRWIVTAGTLGHYVADLAMPLHVSENYDGQLTGQKGIHSYFEDDCVDELYPDVASAVMRVARRQWPEFKKANADKKLSELLAGLAKSSGKEVKTLLALDKAKKNRDVRRDARRYEALIVKRLVEGSLYLAEIYRRNLGWEFDGNRYYFFAGEPEFVNPGVAK